MQALAFTVAYCILLLLNTVVPVSKEFFHRSSQLRFFQRKFIFQGSFKNIFYSKLLEECFPLNGFPSLFSSWQPTRTGYFQDSLLTCEIPAMVQKPPLKRCDVGSAPQQADLTSTDVLMKASYFHPPASNTGGKLIWKALHCTLWGHLTSSYLQ